MLLAHLQFVVRPVPVNLIPYRFSIRRDINIEDTGSFYFTSRVSLSTHSTDTDSLSCGTFSEPSFHQRLASCFVDSNLTHVQGNNILSLLRTHSCFSLLPQDVRTLLDTPRNPAVTFVVEPGEYIHFDLETEIVKSLPNTLSVSFVRELESDFHTDVIFIHSVLAIQCRIQIFPV